MLGYNIINSKVKHVNNKSKGNNNKKDKDSKHYYKSLLSNN